MFSDKLDKFTAIVRKQIVVYSQVGSITLPVDTILITQKAKGDRVYFETAHENMAIKGTLPKGIATRHLAYHTPIVKSPLDSIELEREAGVAPPA